MKMIAWTIPLFFLGVLTMGCESEGQETQARVRLQVFEIPSYVLQHYTQGQNLYELPESSYSLSIVTPDQVDAMLGDRDARPRMLAENNRVIDMWPRLADTWAYSRLFGGLGPEAYCSGGGAGFLGVRERDGQLEIRVEYIVSHSGPHGQKLIESEIFYEYFYPEGRVLLFHAPVGDSEQTQQKHVVALQAALERPVLTPGTAYSKGIPQEGTQPR